MKLVKQVVVPVLVALAMAFALVAVLGAGETQARAAGSQQKIEPRSTCETRRVGQDVEVLVRLQTTDRELDMAADGALVVADLGSTTQTRKLRPETRVGNGYAVTFENLPSDVTPSSFSVRASPSPDDPAVFECNSSAAAAPRVAPASDAVLPSTGG